MIFDSLLKELFEVNLVIAIVATVAIIKHYNFNLDVSTP